MTDPLNEINSESTQEDIDAAVDQIVADRTAEESADDKGDGNNITSETDGALHNTEDTTTDDGSETTGEETSETGETNTDWFDDDLKAEVTAFGISEEELAEFTSREELERTLKFLDRSAMDAGRKATADKSKEVRDEQNQEEQHTSETQKGPYEIQLDKELFDEAIIDEFTQMRDYFESRLKAFDVMERRLIEADQLAEEQMFDNMVDSLGHADLFGKADKVNDKERDRRKHLYSELDAYVTGLESRGRTAEINEALLKRVVRMAFPDELDKKLIKNHTRKVTRQSNSRQGGGATRPTDPKEDPRDEADRLYKELDGA